MATHKYFKSQKRRSFQRITIQKNGRLFFSKSIADNYFVKNYEAVDISNVNDEKKKKGIHLRFIRKIDPENNKHFKIVHSGNYYYFLAWDVIEYLGIDEDNFKDYYLTFIEVEEETTDKKKYLLELKKKKSMK